VIRAQLLLQSNKVCLNTEQAQYTQDKNPKSDRWQHLWQAEGKRRAYDTQEHQMVDERMRVVEESNGLSTALDPLYDTPADQARKKQRAAYLESRQAFLNSQIEYARQMQVSLSYSYPALTAIKGETGANPGDIQKVQARLPQAFNEIRGDIDRISQWLADDPSKAWLFDSVVVSQLKDKTLSAQQRGQLIAEVERQRQSAAGGLMLGSVLSGGLFAASFVPGLQDFAIPLRVAGLGIGGAVAASEIPDLMLLDLAAQSGRGGAGALTNQSPEQARFNLVMGYANVGLAGLDVGLEVGAVQKLAGVTGKLAAAGVQVSREKWSQVMVWAKQGPEGVEKAKAFFASVKGVSKEKAAEAIQLIKNGFSPEVETVGVPGQSAVKTTEENVKDAKAMQSRGNAGGSGKGQEPPKPQTSTTPQLPEFKDVKLGKELGSGGNKIVYEVPGREDIAIAVLEKGRPANAIDKEIELLNDLKEQGLPTVEILGKTTHNGQPAVVMKKYAQGSKDLVRVENKNIKRIGESTLLNEKSVKDLKAIKSIMELKKIKINDLQFLIQKDGTIVISDPLGVTIGQRLRPNENNFKMIDKLIEAAEENIKK
jgi:hypothetical protein